MVNIPYPLFVVSDRLKLRIRWFEGHVAVVFLDIDDDGIEFRVLDELDQLVETGDPGRRPCHIDAFDLRSIRIGIDLAGGIEFSGLRVDDLWDDLALFVKLDGCSDELFEGYRTRIFTDAEPEYA